MNLFRKKSVSKILKDVESGSAADSHGSLHKNLGVRDLTALGIAAIIGAGILSTIGNASASGGPGVIFLFCLQPLHVVLQLLHMQSLHRSFLFQAVHTHIVTLPLAN